MQTVTLLVMHVKGAKNCAKIFLNIENLVELKEKTSLQNVLKGDLPTRSFCILGVSFMGGGTGGDGGLNDVTRPVFHR